MNEDKYLFPSWAKKGSNIPHDWKKYVSEEVMAIWEDFSVNQRMALGRCFDDIASLEEWD
ncbi:recombinase RecA [Klebsiella michiganensis]|uniref:hypothetical protein n=1 Tax=Klebsiella michiganensis TaxID=1134687 RepID=UPI001CCF0EE0|nr:hypothetical protein [Klebsiella michiganensis]MBZ7580084.1 recombinase RecA [Klebsiella michiganensis]MDU7345563.1 hypothetical protein [Klebsiella grimontii]